MAGGANPAMTQAASNPYAQASAAQMGAMATYANPAARAQQMMNPYQQNVVNKTLRDVGSAAQMGLNTIDTQASQAGAFGGSRHGIAMAEAAKGYQQQALDAVGALNQQGYNQAMNNAFRSAQGLQGAGQQSFGYGQQIQNMQMQQGAMQQAAMQQLIDQARQQYQGYASAPTQKMQLPLQALGMVPYSTSQTTSGGTQTSSMNPGLFNYLQVGAQMFGGGS
jgi:hypothetical protein